MSAEWAAHVINSGMTTTDENGKEIPVPFIGPLKSVETWIKWGVPEERCKIVKPGDTIRIKDIEIVCLDSFDRTCIVTTDSTGPDREELTGVCPTDMDDKAVNYLVKTPGGNIYHSGDSHFSIYFAKHGKDYDIDVAFGSFGENPIGMQDKMTSIDVLRMAENLKCKVVVPIHWDVWTNFQADCEEIRLLYDFKKAASTSIPRTRTRSTSTIAAASRTASRRPRTSPTGPACKPDASPGRRSFTSFSMTRATIRHAGQRGPGARAVEASSPTGNSNKEEHHGRQDHTAKDR